MRPRPTPLALVAILPGLLAAGAADDPPASRPLPAFDRIVIDDDFPGGYQVEVADVDGDGRPDVVALGGGTCVWYHNPSWTKRVITGPDTTPGIISSATLDLDSDGKAEVAIAYDFAMREPKRGKLGLAIPGGSIDAPWTFEPIADIPSIHRLRWGDLDGDGRHDLVVAPIFGPAATPPDFQDDASRLVVFPGFADGRNRPEPAPLAVAPVTHAIAVVRLAGSDRDAVLSADNLGVSLHRRASRPAGVPVGPTDPDPGRPLVPGATGTPPDRGASEVHLGRFGRGRALLVTIEPWHGSAVAAYTARIVDHPERGRILDEVGPRTVLDDTLDQGHALWVADVNGDGIDEVFAGHRGEDHRVSVYHFDGTAWNRTVLDRDVAAQDLRGGDLDGDGVPDVVAVGGSTGNVVWYRPRAADPDRADGRR